ncbi:hypothetical protein [Nocardioides sp.]|uniref:hypothetical protein n=1 Tax=Nocardioides sp. TaxID=35761 RepID=UPI00260909C8|nr:hypothetical protein [Nocardioides sp.]MDI6911904.1 hypothetical protein [Nocardioides sp.]
MSVRREELLRRVRMSWEEFLELPHPPKAEWVTGPVPGGRPRPPGDRRAAHRDGEWEPVGRLDEADPTAEVELADVTVPIDLRQVLRD